MTPSKIQAMVCQVVGAIMLIFGATNHDLMIVIGGAGIAAVGLLQLVVR